ncbi:MAG: hypothetical protein H0T76_12985 [Nannocystis sp.]|nr:glycosyltransferase family 39 protein [Nannocystis sp.]MBA3547395.1 hypothetical protein [Nannocystis sp.]
MSSLRGEPGAAALGVFVAAVYLWTAPGRIQFPDDEIVFQTTASLWDDGDLDIMGMSRRTGEPQGRPSGTFGWAPGPAGQRFGFFGHGLSVVALPAYALASLSAGAVPEAWSHAVRSDHAVFHRREHRADWTRLIVSLTNCLVTAASAWLLARWLLALGFLRRTALVTGLAFAFATSAWAYSRTFLSEPLSGLCLLAAAYCVTLRQTGRGSRWLWSAGAIAGFSVHVHVLNVVFLPCLLGYALMGRRRGMNGMTGMTGMTGMLAMIGLGAGLLALGQWLRFGDPLETGRFGYYSEFVAPWEGLFAQLFAPGRSFLLYSPAAALGLLGFAALRRRLPAVFLFAVAAMLLRWLAISTRSDWFGGWSVGSRHLVPVIPLAMLGFAAALERAGQWRAWLRWGWWSALGLGALLSAHLAVHSIFEWMWQLRLDPALFGPGVMMHTSHWAAWASPIAGFFTLKLDVLAVGAMTLAQLGHPGLLVGFVAIALVAGGAAWRLAAALRG